MVFFPSQIFFKWAPQNTGPAAAADSLARLFQEGQVIRATVVKTIDPSHAVLRVKGEHLLVETQVDLPKELEAAFLVVETSPKVVLRLLPESLVEKGPAVWVPRYAARDLPIQEVTRRFSELGNPKEALSGPLQRTFRDLLSLLGAFSPESPRFDPDVLKERIIASGLLFESKLGNLVRSGKEELIEAVLKGDVKGLLLRLRSEVDSAQTAGPIEEQSIRNEFLDGVDPWIRKIELYQILNLSQPGPEEKISLLIPFWFQEGLQFVELDLSLPRREGEAGGDKDFSLLFLLDLTRLGRIRIEVTVKDDVLFCLFATAQPDVSKAIESVLPDLRARLASVGFRAQVDVSTAPVIESSRSLMEARAGAAPWLSVVV